MRPHYDPAQADPTSCFPGTGAASSSCPLKTWRSCGPRHRNTAVGRSLRKDQSECIVHERYSDSEALIEHTAHLGDLTDALLATGSVPGELVVSRGPLLVAVVHLIRNSADG